MNISTARRLESGGPEVANERQAEGLRWFHVTVLSNFARGYDRYARAYRKGLIPESTYPTESYVLEERDLDIGISKACRLKAKLAIPGDQIVAIASRLPAGRVLPNMRNGLGSVWASPDLPVSRVYRVLDGNRLEPMSVEEASAASLALHGAAFHPYPALAPRSVSFLPIARGCQASCPFCFSEASASADQKQQRMDWSAVRTWLQLARSRGAERAVITGGGEPTMLPFPDVIRLVGECRDQITKVVLITNGVSLARLELSEAIERLVALRGAGLSVFAVSRHHQDERTNGALMNAETQTPRLLDAARRAGPCAGLRTRLILRPSEGWRLIDRRRRRLRPVGRRVGR